MYITQYYSQAFTAWINNFPWSARNEKDCDKKTQPTEALVWDKSKVDRETENKRIRTWGMVEIVDASEIESHPTKENYIKTKAMRKENRVDVYLYYTYHKLPPVKEHICALDFSYDLGWYRSLQHRLGKFDTIYVRNPPQFGNGIKVSGCFDDDEESEMKAQVARDQTPSTNAGKNQDQPSAEEKCEPAVQSSSTNNCETESQSSWWTIVTSHNALMIAWTFASSTWSEY